LLAVALLDEWLQVCAEAVGLIGSECFDNDWVDWNP
jgi:hypothetical protein